VVFKPGELEVSAGLSNFQVIRFAQKKNIGGFEFLAHIPGTIGGACKMNAGFSHLKGTSHEMSNILKSVTIMDFEGQLHTLQKEEITFQYRKSNLPKGIVVFATIKTKERSFDDIEQELREIELYRRSVQDVRYPSAGSMFKNPKNQNYSSGQLIDMAGLKGRAVGGAQISEKHGNFFINRGHATSRDMMELIGLAQRTVKEKFGVDLEMEVRYFE
jgi:UDP-N-acetylmuramate dehydrogenase